MKILHTVEFYYPSIGGAQEVVRQLSERMAMLGHDVTVATTKLPARKQTVINGVQIAEFDIKGGQVWGYKGSDVEKYKRFLVEGHFDVVMNYAAQQWATDLFIEVMDKVKARKILVPCGFSGLYVPEFKSYFEKMPKILKGYDASVYLSDDYRDINFAREHGVKNTVLIPNGAGADEFQQKNLPDIRHQLGIDEDSFLIIAVGSHTGVKGHAEAIDVFKKARIKNSTLLIIGNPPTSGGGCTTSCRGQAKLSRFWPFFNLSKKRLLVEDLERKQTVAAYRQADLFLFTSNIEASPLVLFESMAAHLPFLTVDVGNSREIIKWSNGGQLLPTKKDREGFSHVKVGPAAKALEKIYGDQTLRKTLGDTGFKAWKKDFSWEVIVKKYLALYKGETP